MAATFKICPKCGRQVVKDADGRWYCDACDRLVETRFDPLWLIDQELYEGVAEVLAKKYGVTQREKADPSHSVCSIGYSERRKQFFGWSHRAIAGFGVGDGFFPKPPEGAAAIDWDPPKKHARKKIETMDQAKQSAKNFAAWVS